jgi:cell division protein ZapA
MNNMMNDRVRVQIFNREYDMDPGGLTPLEVQSLAGFVDEKMREIAERFAIVDTQKIAVLAAVNIALDYLQLRERARSDMKTLGPRIDALNDLLKGVVSLG